MKILAGYHQFHAVRRAVVRTLAATAQGGDIVLVAGKGHEDYQECLDQRTPFSDAAVATAALREWRGE